MIDTEHLPPALVFAVTRDITDAIRQELGNDDILIEAEFGATGQSGAGEGYRALRGQELEVFASQISAFLTYTGADGIAYPIGMQHAAPSGETHPPDVERLETVHRTVIQKTGRYVPFAQHGGTGAAFIARGLVGKHNVNTAFLVAMASSLAEHVEANREGIRKGKKSAAGTGMYLKAVEAVQQKAIDQLEETGTYGMASRLEEEIRGG
jgi:fructose/tagatose bisphosphate aldolase